MNTKEEIAARIRKHLNVAVEFEKLSKDDLVKLLSAVEKLTDRPEEDVQAGTEQQQQASVQPNIFPLGLVPTVVETMRSRIPKIRQLIQEAVDAALDDAVARPRGGTGEREERKGKNKD